MILENHFTSLDLSILLSDGKESACNAGELGWILSQEDPLEKGMATHSSTLAWRISWTEEPGGLSDCKELDTMATNINTNYSLFTMLS